MTKVRPRGEAVRRYIVENVEKHPRDIARRAGERFGISRQAVHKHIRNLVGERALVVEGNTRQRHYKLSPLVNVTKVYEIDDRLAEDVVWREDIAPLLGPLPDNVMNIWHHGFTEMFNNAIDHSSGTHISVDVEKTATSAKVRVVDNGVGIFKKIQTALHLLDERHAVLELAKGKLTTDPQRHSGEGIFFTSRMFDAFAISSGATRFSHDFGEDADWIMQRPQDLPGTAVIMQLDNHTARTTRKVFRKFTSGEDPAFTKTIVPVRLAQYGDDRLISRSQAKRVMDRVDRFKTVILDFQDVATIGQAFADEIFRVFRREHPHIEVLAVHANAEVQQMIKRAEAGS